MIIDDIRADIIRAMRHMAFSGDVMFSVEHPTIASHGDYATNLALVLSKQLEISPRECAERCVAALAHIQPSWLKKVEIAGPGFINFFVHDDVYHATTQSFSQHGFGTGMLNNKRIIIEHSSPNLFKPFHIGHLMNNTIGESIVRLAEYAGADVVRLSYPSDVSLGIGKAIYVVIKNGIETLRSLITEKGKQCYAEGNQLYDTDVSVQEEVKRITEELYAQVPGEVSAIYEECKTINLQYFIHITHRLGSRFDAYIYESETGIIGEQIVRKHIGSVFAESNGAVIYEGEKDGLHTRVFLNTEGRPTYEAKDIGLLALKFERYHPDLSLFVTDHEQKPYFEVVATAASHIHSEWKEKTIHRTHGRMTFKGQKMSSRLGGVPLAADIVDALNDEVGERAEGLASHDKESVALAAIKFAILRVVAGKNINFDPETSLSFEGDSGPYIQYTIVRARSVLAKAYGVGLGVGAAHTECDASLVEKKIAETSEAVEKAIHSWEPHHVALHALELAQAFNSWYGNTKLIDTENPHTPWNLFVTQTVAEVLEKELFLLGIPVPEKM
jgi:arginyl-tRNA synthetase